MQCEIPEKEFALHKKNALSRRDNSKKGAIDERIRQLIDMINSMPEFYTTSSCSGRIMLIERKSERKDQAEWIFTSHEKVNAEEVLRVLKEKVSHSPIWFKQENMIIHIAARSLEAANRMVVIGNASGFKRSCIISAGNRIMLSLESPESINAIVSKNGSLLISEEGVRELCEEANRRMEINFQRIKRLYREIEKLKVLKNKDSTSPASL
ncbi:MAG: tRNA wybutosine-synthesizing 3 family protein [Candidatus Woesearchaeota archaeon]